MLFDVRVVLEGVALLSKTVATWIALRFFINAEHNTTNTLTVFAGAQCLHSVVLLLGYNGYYLLRWSRSSELQTLVNSNWKLLPHNVRGCAWIDFEQFMATYELWVESFLRCILQEGEKWVMMTYVVLAEQGAYEVVANLGSLVARMLFKFVEDIALTAWSKLLGDGTPSVVALQKSGKLFALLVKFMMLIGVVFICFGIPFCEMLLWILYSNKWLTTSAPLLLKGYCVYVCCMGLCGISEAFMRAAANSRDLNRFKTFQLICGLIYLGSLYLLAHVYDYGSIGVIAANVLSMSLRTLYCMHFGLQYFRRHGAQDHFNVSCFSPFSPGTWAVLFGLVVVLWGSYHKFPLLHDGAVRLGHAACHLSIGVVCFGVFCAVVWARDRLFLVNLKRLWKSENID
uniref:Protein RFT1 homolog n=1 Tax=Eutreptiella gymnastica TaxID=73025 RepID=A0A7S4CC82_9EUGL